MEHLLLLFALSSVVFCGFWSSEEFDAQCDSSCPDEEETIACCQRVGFATGYCKPWGRAECEGRRIPKELRRVSGGHRTVNVANEGEKETVEGGNGRQDTVTETIPRARRSHRHGHNGQRLHKRHHRF